jgi:hypothetical protein
VDEFRLLYATPTADGFIGECKTCPPGTVCDKPGTTLENLPLEKGYWRSGTDSFLIEPCMAIDACTGTNSTSSAVCRTGHEGALCDNCQSGFTKDMFGLCETCQETRVPLPTIIMLSCFVGVLLVSLATKAKGRGKRKRAETDRIKSFRLDRKKSAGKGDVSENIADMQRDKSHWTYKVKTKFKVSPLYPSERAGERARAWASERAHGRASERLGERASARASERADERAHGRARAWASSPAARGVRGVSPRQLPTCPLPLLRRILFCGDSPNLPRCRRG